MSQATRTSDIQPLSEEEIARLDRVARRLHAELRDLLASFRGSPPPGASELSRDLGIDRTTCQRVVSAAAGPYLGPELVGRLPGLKGLQQFLQAVRAAGADPAVLDSVDAAVSALADALQALGPSQSRVVRRIEAAVVPGAGSMIALDADEREESVRERLFEAGCRMTGQYTEVSIATFLFRPTPGNPDRIDMAQVRGFLGHRMRPDAMPFSVLWWVQPASEEEQRRDYETLDQGPVQGRSQGVLMEEFSTTPLPIITSRGPRDRRVVMIDPSGLREGQPFDVVTANRIDGAQTHPARDKPPMHEVWVLGRFPARLLIFDVFLHRSMARACIPTVGAYMVSPNLNETMDRRWLDRFPGGPRLSLLESGARHAAHPAYARYPELLTRIHQRLGWTDGDFVGYRCEVPFPQWGAGYCMSFDYSSTDADST